MDVLNKNTVQPLILKHIYFNRPPNFVGLHNTERKSKQPTKALCILIARGKPAGVNVPYARKAGYKHLRYRIHSWFCFSHSEEGSSKRGLKGLIRSLKICIKKKNSVLPSLPHWLPFGLVTSWSQSGCCCCFENYILTQLHPQAGRSFSCPPLLLWEENFSSGLLASCGHVLCSGCQAGRG